MKKNVKVVFWLLVAVNVIFFAVLKTGLIGGAQDEAVLSPLHDEKIALLPAPQSAIPAATVVAAVPVEVVAASAPVLAKASETSCFEWGEFLGDEQELAASALNKLQLGDKLAQREIDRNIGYWVYISPLKDKAAVTQKVAQLKARGVTDYFVVQEAGEWLNAISLGVFKSRESAQNFLQGLRTKNVTSAQMGERAGKSKAKIFIINNIDVAMQAKLSVLQKNFSGSELKSTACH